MEGNHNTDSYPTRVDIEVTIDYDGVEKLLDTFVDLVNSNTPGVCIRATFNARLLQYYGHVPSDFVAFGVMYGTFLARLDGLKHK